MSSEDDDEDYKNKGRKGEKKRYRWLKVRHTLEDDFRTPPFIFDSVNTKFGPFTLDVCASAENNLCQQWFSKEQNALTQQWNAENCWCNPPYKDTKAFVQKALEQVINNSQCNRAVILLQAYTDCSVWHEIIFRHATTIVFVRSRIAFHGPHVRVVKSVRKKTTKPANARHASALVVFDKGNLGTLNIKTLWARNGSFEIN